MPLSNYPNGFSGGVAIRGLPVLNTYPGQVLWVNSNGGSNGNRGTRDQPLATIDNAIGKCNASAGDIVVVHPYHAETVTAAITLDVIGVQVIGLRHGYQMPTITGSGAIDAVTMTAAGCGIANIKFAAPAVDAQTADINIAAANCTVANTVHIGSTTDLNKVDIITLAAGAHYALIDGIRVTTAVVEVVGGIKLEGVSNAVEVRNCCILDTIGFTNGALYDAATCTNLYIHNNVFSNAKAGTVVMGFGNNSTGVCSFNHINGRHTTIASNVTAGTGMAFFENRVVEQAALNGAIIPAADTE